MSFASDFVVGLSTQPFAFICCFLYIPPYTTIFLCRDRFAGLTRCLAAFVPLLLRLLLGNTLCFVDGKKSWSKGKHEDGMHHVWKFTMTRKLS